MKAMIYIGPEMDKNDPKKGEQVFVYNETDHFGIPMVQIIDHPAGCKDKDVFYPLTAFREPLDYGDTLVNELAYKAAYFEDYIAPKLGKNELKKENYLRSMRK